MGHQAVIDDVNSHTSQILQGLRALVVDDDGDSCLLTALVLEEYGVEVTTVASVSEAMAQLVDSQPDFLISDIAMPNEDGFSLIRRVRAMELDQGTQMPAIALTAFVTADASRDALEAGFQAHLVKPFDPDNLVAVLAELLQAVTH